MTASRGYKWVVRVCEHNRDHFCLHYERASADKLSRDPYVLSFDVDPHNAVRSAMNKLTKHIDQVHQQIKALAIQSIASVLVGKKKVRL